MLGVFLDHSQPYSVMSHNWTQSSIASLLLGFSGSAFPVLVLQMGSHAHLAFMWVLGI